MKRLARLLCVSAIFCVSPTVAQHSDDDEGYDLEATTEIRGQATRIWSRPALLIVSVGDQAGRTESWRIEFDEDGGDLRDTLDFLGALRLGDDLVVTGYAAATPGDRRIQATNILRPSDGLAWRH